MTRLNAIITTISLFHCGAALAQVDLDAPLVLDGDSAQRAVIGIADPLDGTAAITVEASLRASWAWCSATLQDTVVSLTVSPPVTDYVPGLLLRFRVEQPMQGELYINLDGSGAWPLERPDGLPLAIGQLVPGIIAEVVLADGRYVLLNAPEVGCPNGYTQVNARYCIETAPPATTGTWPWAADRCAAQGGKLCTWGEYIGACSLVASGLAGMFSEWEWIDDTSNHTHGANQVGRTTCMSERTALFTVPARSRCCHHLR